MSKKILFDDWPDRYDQWFKTPIGKLVKETEAELIRKLLDLKPLITVYPLQEVVKAFKDHKMRLPKKSPFVRCKKGILENLNT